MGTFVRLSINKNGMLWRTSSSMTLCGHVLRNPTRLGDGHVSECNIYLCVCVCGCLQVGNPHLYIIIYLFFSIKA